MPREAEVHGLVALMEIQASRSPARTGPTAGPILLLDQDRARWDQLLIRRGLAALDRPRRSAGARPLRAAGRDRRLPRARRDRRGDRLGPHRRALRRAGPARPSPVVELNRAVAVGDGRRAGRGPGDRRPARGRARAARLPPAAERARRFPRQAGRLDEAAEEFARAASLTRNEARAGATARPCRGVRTGRVAAALSGVREAADARTKLGREFSRQRCRSGALSSVGINVATRWTRTQPRRSTT